MLSAARPMRDGQIGWRGLWTRAPAFFSAAQKSVCVGAVKSQGQTE